MRRNAAGRTLFTRRAQMTGSTIMIGREIRMRRTTHDSIKELTPKFNKIRWFQSAKVYRRKLADDIAIGEDEE